MGKNKGNIRLSYKGKAGNLIHYGIRGSVYMVSAKIGKNLVRGDTFKVYTDGGCEYECSYDGESPESSIFSMETLLTEDFGCRFDKAFAGVMRPTIQYTTFPGGEYQHYVTRLPYSVSDMYNFLSWVDEMEQRGFTVHHCCRRGSVDEVFMTSEKYVSKVTCVNGHINVQFFADIESMNKNREKTMGAICRINRLCYNSREPDNIGNASDTVCKPEQGVQHYLW